MKLYSQQFLDYLDSIGEIPKGIELDLDNDNIFYRYLAQNIVNKEGNPSYGVICHGEVFVNGKSIGYFEINQHSSRTPEQEEKNWFWREYIAIPSFVDKKSIRRSWNTKYIWCNSEDLQD